MKKPPVKGACWITLVFAKLRRYGGRNMRVCLIGTSNAIYRDGYAGAIRNDPRVTHFENHSVGASPSTVIPLFGSRIDFSMFDFVVIDTAINDRHFYINKAISTDMIREHLAWVIAKASQAGCRTALLVMPTRRVMDKETLAGRIYLDAAPNAAALLDGFDFVRTCALIEEVDPRSLFSDDNHVHRRIARMIGRALVSKMAAAMSTPLRITQNTVDYDRVDGGLCDAQLVQRENSVFKLTFAAVSPGNPAEITGLMPGSEVVGISFNAVETCANVRISADTCTIKTLHTSSYGHDKNLILSAAPVMTPCLIGASGKLQLSITTDDPTEPSKSADRISNSPMYAEIASVVLRRAA